MNLSEYRDLAEAIKDDVDSHDNFREQFATEYPAWWGKILTSLALVIGPKPAETLKLVSVASKPSVFTICVITDQLLLLGTVENPSEAAAKHWVRAVSLEEVEAIDVQASNSFFSRNANYWPGTVSLKLQHPALLEQLELPLDPMDVGPKVHNQISDLLSTLSKGLAV